ncbi:hypothetical protein [Leptospira haakeii]|uniref:hypothetical protein n=1 Tax=Leptospira haakeii TaxID=2023198 RepID=UPI000F630151|nr:hypothetical protein [Leptospira haakeii]
MNKLIQRDIILLSAIFIVHILKYSGSLDLTYLKLDLTDEKTQIILWGLYFAIIIATISHLNKIFILLREIDRIVKNDQSEPFGSSEGEVAIRKSQIETVYYLSDNFISDFLITGSDRIPSFRKFMAISSIFLILLCILNSYFCVSLINGDFLKLLASVISSIFIYTLLLRLGIFRKSVQNQRRIIQSSLAYALVDINGQIEQINYYHKLQINKKFSDFQKSLNNREYLFNLFEDKYFLQKLNHFHSILKPAITTMESKLSEYKEGISTKVNDPVEDRKERERSVLGTVLSKLKDFDLRINNIENMNSYGMFLEFFGIRYGEKKSGLFRFYRILFCYFVFGR